MILVVPDMVCLIFYCSCFYFAKFCSTDSLPWSFRVIPISYLPSSFSQLARWSLEGLNPLILIFLCRSGYDFISRSASWWLQGRGEAVQPASLKCFKSACSDDKKMLHGPSMIAFGITKRFTVLRRMLGSWRDGGEALNWRLKRRSCNTSCGISKRWST